MYLPNNIMSKYMRQKLTELQGEIDKSAIIVEDFNISQPEMDISAENQKDIVELNTNNQLGITDIYGLL